MHKILSAVAASLAAALALTACGSTAGPGATSSPSGSPAASTSAPTSGETVKLVVGASPVPHAKILEPEGFSHSPHLEHPRAVSEHILRFLREL